MQFQELLNWNSTEPLPSLVPGNRGWPEVCWVSRTGVFMGQELLFCEVQQNAKWTQNHLSRDSRSQLNLWTIERKAGKCISKGVSKVACLKVIWLHYVHCFQLCIKLCLFVSTTETNKQKLLCCSVLQKLLWWKNMENLKVIKIKNLILPMTKSWK